jgi:peptidylprolyl isomerase
VKFLALIVVCASAAVGLAACGGASSEDSSTAAAKTNAFTDTANPPKVELPPGPPPKHLVVRDVKVGSGPAIPPKGRVGIRTNFVALGYRTGKPYEVKWKPKGAFNISFGPGLEIKGWEKGLVGMKAGGRRELEIPSKMAYGVGPAFYVVDLLEVKPDGLP